MIHATRMRLCPRGLPGARDVPLPGARIVPTRGPVARPLKKWGARSSGRARMCWG